ncbi:MAG: DUF3489 domain-containing protein [Xanthobacteraceae bacterium]|nr:DUF3489 domain-containing protein [Xanthobacteraceae bacterium]MCW5678238.1 DUF3489 domain-containing protein [Xanthobacteraceae bacterium]
MPKKQKKAKAKKSKKSKKSTTKRKIRSSPQSALKPSSTGSKAAIVTELLERPSGASITELTTRTGWQPHTCRAKISVLGNSIKIEKSKNTDGTLVYRKVSGSQASTAKR